MKLTRHLLAALFFVLSVAFAVAFARPASHNLDGSQRPEWVTPSPSTVANGNQFSITVTMDGECATDTTVNLISSNTSLITVPATIIVPGGSDQGVGTGSCVGDGAPTNVTITATANGGEAQGTVTAD